MSTASRTLTAVLLAPPLTSGVRTTRAVARAAVVLGYDAVVVANLLDVPTRNTAHVATFGSDDDSWLDSRQRLEDGVQASSALLLAWGLPNNVGSARSAMEVQIRWLVGVAEASGHKDAWAVGDVRHPSRWHQYTADKHGHTVGGDFNARLRRALVRRPLGDYLPPPRLHGVGASPRPGSG
jgi:hypothetical protein